MSPFVQALAVARYDLKLNFVHRRNLPLFLLALMPLGITFVIAWVAPRFGAEHSLGELKGIFAAIYQAFILRTVVFFGCVWVFMNRFRGEIVDRTLHYLFLVPIRRDALLAGKFAAGLVMSILLFGGSVGASFVILFGLDELASASMVGELASYLGIVALGCFGYGAIFTLLGILFRNPIPSAIGLFGWEWLHFLLPAALKKLSVIHYLKGLAPVPLSSEEGTLALIGDPVSWPGAIVGLGIFSLAVLVVSALLLRRLEISYAED